MPDNRKIRKSIESVNLSRKDIEKFETVRKISWQKRKNEEFEKLLEEGYKATAEIDKKIAKEMEGTLMDGLEDEPEW